MLAQTYRRFWNANQEDDASHEKADREVAVDGGAGSLYGAAELKSQDAQHETQQRDDQPFWGHHQEPEVWLTEKDEEV